MIQCSYSLRFYKDMTIIPSFFTVEINLFPHFLQNGRFRDIISLARRVGEYVSET